MPFRRVNGLDVHLIKHWMILEKPKQDETLLFLGNVQGRLPNLSRPVGAGLLGLHTLFKAAFWLKATRRRVRTPKASRKAAGCFPWILHEVLSDCGASSHRFSVFRLRHRELLLGTPSQSRAEPRNATVKGSQSSPFHLDREDHTWRAELCDA